MPRRLCLAVLLLAAPPAASQAWVAADDALLVQRAVAARTARDADALLAGWRAVASGIVRFAVVTHHGADSVERVMRADQLRVEVYGEAPNRSKQEIVAWRDTSFAPNRISYHRDHLGIVANDFGAVIRLGQGDEVRDVPHPLSADGLRHYEYRLGDTVAVGGPEGRIRVVAVFVRPRDPAAPGTVGTLYLDAERAALVRFGFTFTASSYRDPTVAAISVELENALLDGRFWLPRRQAITIRREGPLLALPMHTVLRAEWRIGEYLLGISHPPTRFAGALVAGLRAPGGTGWDEPLDAALVGLPTIGADLEAIVSLADDVAPDAWLDGMPRLRLLGDRGLSSLLHVNRVEGITPGAGLRLGIGGRARLDLHGAFGTAASLLTARASLTHALDGRTALEVTLGREVTDVADGAFGSGAMNSLTTVITGDDAGSWLLRDLFSTVEIRGEGASLRWRLAAVAEQVDPLPTRFTALDGTRGDNPALGAGRVHRAVASLGSAAGRGALEWQVAVEYGRGEDRGWGRIAGRGGGRVAPFEWRVEAGMGSRDLPGYRSFLTGGRGTLVGVPHRAIGGRRLALVEVALPLAMRPPAPVLGRVAAGMLASRITPFLAAAVAGGAVAGVPWQATGTIEPVVGVRLDLWGPLLRLEAGWAVRQGGVGLTLDAHPDWWSIL